MGLKRRDESSNSNHEEKKRFASNLLTGAVPRRPARIRVHFHIFLLLFQMSFLAPLWLEYEWVPGGGATLAEHAGRVPPSA
jgi:hypothetical protein